QCAFAPKAFPKRTWIDRAPDRAKVHAAQTPVTGNAGTGLLFGARTGVLDEVRFGNEFTCRTDEIANARADSRFGIGHSSYSAEHTEHRHIPRRCPNLLDIGLIETFVCKDGRHTIFQLHRLHAVVEINEVDQILLTDRSNY